MEKNKKLNLISCFGVFFVLLLKTLALLGVKYVEIIGLPLNLFIIFLFLSLCNPFLWSKSLIIQKKEKINFIKSKIRAIVLVLAVVIVKNAYYFLANYYFMEKSSNTNTNFLLIFLEILIGVISEEFLFKAGLYRLAESFVSKHFISVAMVSFLFGICHIGQPLLYIFFCFLYQIFSIYIFDLYPSLLLVILLHFGFNSSLLIGYLL